MTSTADLHTAVTSIWNASTLNTEFNSYWTAAQRLGFAVLHDQLAGPLQPFPYCVFEQTQGDTETRMSSGVGNPGRREIRRVPWSFTVQTRKMSGVALSAKAIAADLVDEIMKVFGGHPTAAPANFPDLTQGYILQCTYENELPIRIEDDNFSWKLMYAFRLDVPVRA